MQKILLLNNLNIGIPDPAIKIGTGGFNANILKSDKTFSSIRINNLDTTIFSSLYNEPIGNIWFNVKNIQGESLSGLLLFGYGLGDTDATNIRSELTKFPLGFILPDQDPERDHDGYKYKIRLIPNARLSSGHFLQIYSHSTNFGNYITFFGAVSVRANKIFETSDQSNFFIQYYPYGYNGKYENNIPLPSNHNNINTDLTQYKKNVIKAFDMLHFPIKELNSSEYYSDIHINLSEKYILNPEKTVINSDNLADFINTYE